MLIRYRDTEACEPEPQLLWDTVWVQRLDASGGYGDWMMAESGNQRESLGGLRAEAALHTATLLQLFTDRRLPEDRTNPSQDSDPRGWWGNQIRLDGESDEEMGSLLWTLHRSVLTDRIARDARDIVADAMTVFASQGAVARTDVETSIDRKAASLLIVIRHYSHSGEMVYDQRFGVLWAQAERAVPMNYGDRSLVLA